jgi:hypothetical protein
VVATLTPASGASFAAPTNILITARAYAGNTNLSRVEFYANGTLVGVDTVGPDFSCTWTNPPPGLYALSTRAVQGDDANALSSPALVTVEAASAAAIWVPSNTTRQGGWLGDLGRQGYLVAGDSTNAPSYANASVGSQVITWAGFTTDSRALQRDSGNGRLAAAWYDYTNVVLDVQCTDALFHRLNVYCLDWYSQGRTQTVDVIDNVSGIVLDHRQHEPFYGGTWLTWEIRGHVRLRFQCAGNLPAVVSGVFFDPSASMPTITITNPIAGAIFTSPTNLSIAADAVADANNVTRVDFYDGTILLGSVTNGPPYVFQWNNPPLGGRFVLAREVGPAGTVDSVAVRLNVVATNSVCFLNTTYLPDGTAQFDVCGPPGTTMRLDASFVLGPNAAWTPVQTNSSGAGRFSFLVTDPLIYPQRFYRIVPLP